MSVHHRDQNIQATSLQLLNRLSDWLFVASRTLQRAEGGSEVLWQKISMTASKSKISFQISI